MQYLIFTLLFVLIIAICSIFVYYEPTLDLVLGDTKKLLLWYNKEGNNTTRHYVKLLEF